jgi:UDP-2-acetamido-3-amino-2,3-dideoxy-glucuronate N-acetyltransferase
MKNSYYIHPAAIVEAEIIGEDTRIWAFVHILKDVKIGKNVNVCDHCFIESDVIIGDNVTIKCGVYLWSGISIRNNVFIGPNVVFTNDLRPRSRQGFKQEKTVIEEGASLGANSTVLAGIRVGAYSFSGIGSVITKDVPNHALVYGNPAKIKGWVDEMGRKLTPINDSEWVSEDGIVYIKSLMGLARK